MISRDLLPRYSSMWLGGGLAAAIIAFACGGDETLDCQGQGDCSAEQVCPAEILECQDALTYSYHMTVDLWSPDDCPGVELAHLYYKAKVNGVTQTTSVTTNCPGAWAEHINFEPDSIVELELWYVDVFGGMETMIMTFCFRDAADKCTTVPLDALHDGGFKGPAGTSAIELRIDPDQPL